MRRGVGLGESGAISMKVQRAAVLLGGVALVVAVVLVRPWGGSQADAVAREAEGPAAWTGADYAPPPAVPADSAERPWHAVPGAPTAGRPEPLPAPGEAGAPPAPEPRPPTEAPAPSAIPVPAPDSTAGDGVHFREGFDDANLAARGWYDNRNPVISGAAPRSGAGALEMMFARGARLAVRGGALRRKFPRSERVVVSYWVRYSPHWRGSGKTYHPHEFHVLTSADDDFIGPSATHLTTYIEHNWQRGGVPRLAITDALNIDTTALRRDLSSRTERRAVAGCNGGPGKCYRQVGWRNELGWSATSPAFLPDPGPGYQADWHRVEVEFRLNSIRDGRAVRDGVARYWFDGTLVIDRTDVLFRTAQHPAMKFDQFVIAPYIGDGSPAAQGMWVDDLVVASERVP